MCVIAVSPKGVTIPNMETMKDMFDYNSDGAGFAYSLNKRVYIEKGFMTYEEFEYALKNLETKLDKKYKKNMTDLPILFHFRIGTHGPNNRALTHPFPVSENKKHIEALDLYTDLVMAHNGTISAVKPVNGWSDTTQYIKDVLFPLYTIDKQFYLREPLQELINNTINGSRFVFLDKYGDFTLLGDWKDSKDKTLEGIKFSNLNHEYIPSYKYGGWNGKSNYSYSDDYYYMDKIVKTKLKKLPAGTCLLNERDLDKEFNLKKNAVVYTIPEKSPEYFVDELGDIYARYVKDGNFYSVRYYDYATEGTKPEDILYNYILSDHRLANVPEETHDCIIQTWGRY